VIPYTASMDDKYVTLDGLQTRYFDEGSGKPVLLLHGAAPGTSAEVYAPNIGPLVARGLRVLALDMPGWGLTDAPKDHSVAYRREHVARFIDALGLEKVTVVGHSMAGGLVMQLAFQRPERLDGIVILGSGTILPPLPDKVASPPVHDTDHEPTPEDIRHELEANTFDHTWITPELVKRRYELAIGKNFESAKAREATPREREDPPFWQRLDQVPVPALYLYGRQDRGSIAEREPIARQRYPNLNLHVFDGCKHMVQWDRADDVVRLVSEFVLSGAPAGAR
jgi:pimeloyl-ACP methyl ester carboxylesterase